MPKKSDFVIRNGTLVAYRGNGGDVIIPDNVIRIGDYAFYKCTSLLSIIIPNSVTRIGYWTFEGCVRLKSITVPDSVTFIGSGAFLHCIGLTSITIPGSVKSIRAFVFSDCSDLKSVTIPNSVTSIGSYAFEGCKGLRSKKGYYKAFIPTDNPNILKAGQNNTEYKIGEKKSCLGKLGCCTNGIHLCTNIFDIFNYYYGEYGKDFVIAICDASDDQSKHEGDSKIACRWIVPKRVLSRQEVINIMNGD